MRNVAGLEERNHWSGGVSPSTLHVSRLLLSGGPPNVPKAVRTLGLRCGPTRGPDWVLSDPPFYGDSLPNSTASQAHLRHGKVWVRLNDLDSPLPRDTEHLREFGHAHQVTAHGLSLARA